MTDHTCVFCTDRKTTDENLLCNGCTVAESDRPADPIVVGLNDTLLATDVFAPTQHKNDRRKLTTR